MQLNKSLLLFRTSVAKPMTPYALSFKQMEALCRQLHHFLLGSILVNLPAINKRQFFLIFKKNSHQEALFLCFQPPFLRFHLSHLIKIPVKGPAHPLFTYLNHYQLHSIELLNQDRILRLGFSLKESSLFLIGEFFPKHPNYYLINQEGKILFSLYSMGQTHYHLPSQPQMLSAIRTNYQPILSHPEIEALYLQLEEEFRFRKEKNSLESRLKQQLKRLQKRQDKLQQEFSRCLTWEKVQQEGELLKANFPLLRKGLSTVTVWNWVEEKEQAITLDPKLSPQEAVAQRFRSSKKLYAGQNHLQKQIQKTKEEIMSLNHALHLLKDIQSLDALEPLQNQLPFKSKTPRQPKEALKTPSLPYYEYESATGLKIWVGKNAQDNEKLTFSLSKGSDWWLHTQDFPGSHIIIRVNNRQEPDQETFLDAIQLALHYSKAKNRGEAEICITQRKFVSRFGKGQTGKVQISTHKTVLARLDINRYQRVKERRQI